MVLYAWFYTHMLTGNDLIPKDPIHYLLPVSYMYMYGRILYSTCEMYAPCALAAGLTYMLVVRFLNQTAC